MPFFNIPKTGQDLETLLNETPFEATDESMGRDVEDRHDHAATRTVISESTNIFGFSDLGLESVAGDENEAPSTPSDSHASMPAEENGEADHPSIKGMKSHNDESKMPDFENKMLTENADVAYRSSGDYLVKLFY